MASKLINTGPFPRSLAASQANLCRQLALKPIAPILLQFFEILSTQTMHEDELSRVYSAMMLQSPPIIAPFQFGKGFMSLLKKTHSIHNRLTSN